MVDFPGGPIVKSLGFHCREAWVWCLNAAWHDQSKYPNSMRFGELSGCGTHPWTGNVVHPNFTKEEAPVLSTLSVLSLYTSHVCVYSIVSNSLWPTDCTQQGFSVHGIFSARILEWAAISSSREFSQPGNWICVSFISGVGRQVLYYWATMYLLPSCLFLWHPSLHSKLVNVLPWFLWVVPANDQIQAGRSWELLVWSQAR